MSWDLCDAVFWAIPTASVQHLLCANTYCVPGAGCSLGCQRQPLPDEDLNNFRSMMTAVDSIYSSTQISTEHTVGTRHPASANPRDHLAIRLLKRLPHLTDQQYERCSSHCRKGPDSVVHLFTEVHQGIPRCQTQLWVLETHL